MRMRKLVAATLLAGGALLLLPTVASAQEEPASGTQSEVKYADHTAEECAKLLEEGKKVDDCQEAPSPILPETNELIWGIISFTVLLGLLYKFAWPGMKAGMQARTERIRGDLDAADSAKADAQHLLDDYKAQLADAKNESARIIEEARQTADNLKRDAEQRLQTELAELRTRASADVEAAKTQAIADLRSEVATLAIGAAEVVVQKNLDRNTQVQLIENYINQVGARSS
jgi:F-type H+-transporting ATPase subunit b